MIFRFRVPLKNISVLFIHTLMVKHIHTLALRAMQTNQSVAASLTRIQHGFMPEKNIDQAQQVLQQLQEMLAEMRKSLVAPPSHSSNAVPLK